MAVCSKCGHDVSETSVVCQNCGNVLKNPFDEMNKKFVQTGAHIQTDDDAKTQSVQPITQQSQTQQSQVMEQQPVEQIETQESVVPDTAISEINPAIKYGVLGFFIVDILFFVVRALLSTKGSSINVVIIILCIAFLVILGYNKHKNMQASFKDGYVRLLTIILILDLLAALFNPVGFIRSILSIGWWLGTIIACFGLFVGYYITKKLDIIITSKLELDDIIDFIIVDLGIVLPIIALLLKIWTR